MRFQAVIFDLDGTLIDTERLVVEAGLAAFSRYGLAARLDILENVVGTVGDEATTLLTDAFGPQFDSQGFYAAWSDEADLAFAAGIPLRPGVHDLLDRIDGLGLPRAIATNSRTTSAHSNMTAAGLHVRFEHANIHGRDRVNNPKPAPDLFLHAARALGVDPAHCLVFEDSDPGTAAGLAAGMTVVQVPDQRPAGTRDAHVIATTLMEGARAIGLLT